MKKIKASLKRLKEKINNIKRSGGVDALKKEIDRITKQAETPFDTGRSPGIAAWR